MPIVLSDYNVQGLGSRAHELWKSADYLDTLPTERRLANNVAGIWAALLLRHIAMELYLKAVLAHKVKVLYKGHNLAVLYNLAKQYIDDPEDDWQKWIEELNPASDNDGGMMRYPKSGSMSWSTEQDQSLERMISTIKVILGSSTIVPESVKTLR